MIISIKIKKQIESEIKNQKSLLKLVTNQETNYQSNVGDLKDTINQSIQFYEKILKEAS